MTQEEFDTILEDRINSMRVVLAAKGKEYGDSRDRLHNFKRSSDILGTSPEDVCVGYLTKHLVAVLDMADRAPCFTRAMIDEKVGDLINYLVLLEAIFIEALGENSNTD